MSNNIIIDLYKKNLFYYHYLIYNNIHKTNYKIFFYDKNIPLNKDDIPSDTIYLIFGKNFNQILKKNDIPNSVVFIQFHKFLPDLLNNSYIPDNVIEIIFCESYNKNKLNFNKNIILCEICNNNEVIYNDYCMIIDIDNKDKLINFITNDFMMNKNMKNNIHKELIEKFFNPKWLLSMCSKYNIEFDELLDIY